MDNGMVSDSVSCCTDVVPTHRYEVGLRRSVASCSLTGKLTYFGGLFVRLLMSSTRRKAWM